MSKKKTKDDRGEREKVARMASANRELTSENAALRTDLAAALDYLDVCAPKSVRMDFIAKVRARWTREA